MMTFSRRSLLAGTAASIAMMAAGRGWAQASGDAGIMTHIVGAEPPTYDFHATQTSFVAQTLAPCYSTLLKFDVAAYPAITGDLAESWEASDDLMSYTFLLKPGITFHDGTPCTAEDVKASFDRILTPPEGIVAIRKSELGDIASVEVVDPSTVRFNMKSVNVAMLNNFANPWHVIYSAARLAEDPNYPATEVMGTGPFKLASHENGVAIILRKHDGYHVEGEPYLNEIRANFVSGPAVTTALSAGQADGMFQFVTPQQRDSIAEVQGDEFVFDESLLNSLIFATFNTTHAPFDDIRVRRALHLAIDRHLADQALQAISLLKYANGYFAPGSQFSPEAEALEALPGYSRDIEASRAEARALLEEAGQTGLKIRFTTRNLPPFEPPTVFLADQWRQIGVEAEIVKLDTPQYFAALEARDFDVAVEGYNFNTDDPNDILQKFLPESTINYAGNTDPELTDLYAAIKTERDPATRIDMGHQYQARLLEQAYYAPLLWNRRITVRRKNLMGWVSTPVLAIGLQFPDMRFEG